MKTERVAWLDLVRVVACFCVVLAHCCDPFVSRFDSAPSEFLPGVLWGSFLRPAVPFFVMITGVLLLPIKMDMGSFYRRRLSRVLFPLVFWSILTPILYFLYLSMPMGAQTLNPGINLASYTIDGALQKMYSFIFNFNYDITPLWYLYMLVGLYLIMPIISGWLTQATRRDIRIFLLIWIIATSIPYVQMLAPMLGYQGNYGNMGLFGVCDWNAYGTFYYFSGFLGYIVLAYYLVKFPLNWSWSKTWAVALPVWAVGYAITSVGFLATQKLYPGNFAELEVIWFMSGINVMLMTAPLFVIMQKIEVKESKVLTKISSLTFGIYLCHFFVVQVAYDIVYPHLNIAPGLKIPLIAIIAFIVSLFVVWALSKLPFKKYIIG